MADGQITSDQIGDSTGGPYGAEIGPMGGADMWAYDTIVGGPTKDRTAAPDQFTGGTGGGGIGGTAEGLAPGGTGPDGTLLERRGF